jgi:RNA polymerase sigma factor (sigma-70 family)
VIKLASEASWEVSDPPAGRSRSPTLSNENSVAYVQYGELARAVRAQSAGAAERLYQLLGPRLRNLFARELGPIGLLEDCVHDVFLSVFTAITAGRLHEPERLMGFVAVIARRRLSHYTISKRLGRDNCGIDECPPEQLGTACSLDEDLFSETKHAMLRRAMDCLTGGEKDLLERIYFQEHERASICAELKLTETQFRLRKSRAKLKLVKIARELWPASS